MTDLNVIQRLANVASELGPIQKREVNAGSGGRYQAFAVDDVYAHIGPLLAKHGVVLVPRVDAVSYGDITSSRGASGTSARVIVDYVFHATDGSQVAMSFAAEGHDYQDKATNKALQQALKYALIQTFQIATGEVDPDAAELPDTAPKLEVVHTDDPVEARVKQEAFRLADGDVEKARNLFTDSLQAAGFPLDVALTEADADQVIAVMSEAVTE